ncbi:MAG: RluA family pseudouridine synthase [Chloroflexi bacterium]|nr:RluA family pseudouridine synthase [Chloroflexota bacterium]
MLCRREPVTVVQVAPGETETRLDRLLTRELPDLSRSSIKRLIESGHVRVDGQPARASWRPVPGARITVEVPPPVPTTLVPRELPLRIIYRDDDVLVIDKPPGLVVHPAPGHAQDTLVNALIALEPALHAGEPLRPGIVHRLDKDTSGLIVVARNERALRELQGQMQRRQVRKEYLALVRDFPDPARALPERGTIEAPIGRHPRERQRMAVVERGRPARTHFVVRERSPGYALVEVQLETGRTHQIRVHLAAIGHPVAGDPIYGTAGELGLGRQFLHAWHLGFARPSDGAWVELESPLPADLAVVRDRLRGR